MATSKLRAATSATLEDMTMDISSMIDLVFLLLIFFMVSSHIIIVQLDPTVKPPVADASDAPTNALGRIVINIRPDGSVASVDGVELATADGEMDQVISYIQELADGYREADQLNPKLHIRADRDVEVKRIKEVVKAGAEAQVIDVIFAAYKEGN